MNPIIVYVKDGLVCDVENPYKDIQVEIRDYDAPNCGDHDSNDIFTDEDGEDYVVDIY
jgi:hypothetical protein